jgi:hypothetical protein
VYEWLTTKISEYLSSLFDWLNHNETGKGPKCKRTESGGRSIIRNSHTIRRRLLSQKQDTDFNMKISKYQGIFHEKAVRKILSYTIFCRELSIFSSFLFVIPNLSSLIVFIIANNCCIYWLNKLISDFFCNSFFSMCYWKIGYVPLKKYKINHVP